MLNQALAVFGCCLGARFFEVTSLWKIYGGTYLGLTVALSLSSKRLLWTDFTNNKKFIDGPNRARYTWRRRFEVVTRVFPYVLLQGFGFPMGRDLLLIMTMCEFVFWTMDCFTDLLLPSANVQEAAMSLSRLPTESVWKSVLAFTLPFCGTVTAMAQIYKLLL